MLRPSSPFSLFLFCLLVLPVKLVVDGADAPVGRRVKAEDRREIAKTEFGTISGVDVDEGSGLKKKYHLQFISLDPNSLFLPAILHADMVFYVHTGSGKLGYSEEEDLKEVELEKGDVYRLKSGTIFYFQSNLETERPRFRINALFSNAEQELQGNWVGAYSSIHELFSGFDKKLLQAAFKVSEEVIEQIKNASRTPPIVHAGPVEKEDLLEVETSVVKAILGITRFSMDLNFETNKKHKHKPKPFNVFKEKHDVGNCNGWSKMVTAKDLPALKGSSVGVFMVNLSTSAMMGPHWNPIATEVAVVLEGRGMARVVCPSNLTRQECNNTRFKIEEGDVFVVPRFHPMAQMSFNNETLVFMGFSTSNRNNHPQFLAGEASVLHVLKKGMLELSFGVNGTTVSKLLGAKKGSVILDCVSCAEEEEAAGIKEDKERKQREEEERKRREEEERKRKEEERRRQEEEGRKQQEEEERRQKEEEERRRQEEEEMRQQEEARRQQQEEEKRRQQEEEEEEKRRQQEEEERRQQEKKERRRRQEEEERRQQEEEERRQKEERERRQRQEEEEERRQQKKEEMRQKEEKGRRRRQEEERRQQEAEQRRKQKEKEQRQQEEEEEEERARREEKRTREEERRREQEEEGRAWQEEEERRREKERRHEQEETEGEVAREEEEQREREERGRHEGRRQEEERERRQEEESEVEREETEEEIVRREEKERWQEKGKGRHDEGWEKRRRRHEEETEGEVARKGEEKRKREERKRHEEGRREEEGERRHKEEPRAKREETQEEKVRREEEEGWREEDEGGEQEEERERQGRGRHDEGWGERGRRHEEQHDAEREETEEELARREERERQAGWSQPWRRGEGDVFHSSRRLVLKTTT